MSDNKLNISKEDEYVLRAMSNMKLFSLYLDDITKYKVLCKLKEMGLDTQKGSLSALIRVLLQDFASATDSAYLATLVEKINNEYLFTTKKNKRSHL